MGALRGYKYVVGPAHPPAARLSSFLLQASFYIQLLDLPHARRVGQRHGDYPVRLASGTDVFRGPNCRPGGTDRHCYRYVAVPSHIVVYSLSRTGANTSAGKETVKVAYTQYYCRIPLITPDRLSYSTTQKYTSPRGVKSKLEKPSGT